MSSMILWLIAEAVNAAFWLWILRWGGAEYLEGSFLAGFFADGLSIRWDAEGIRLYALLMLIVSSIGFAIGIFFPGLR